MTDLADILRDQYRQHFAQALAENERRPLVLPYCLLGPFIVPTLWLAIPHTKRPWLYETRWLVLAFVLYFNTNLIRSASSGNVACAYASGLMASWGIVLTLHHLFWTRPQFEALRAVKATTAKGHTKRGLNGITTSANGVTPQNGLRQRKKNTSQDAESDDLENTHETEAPWVWQSFPEDAPFWQRLNWAFDLVTSFRGVGWNWSIPSVPLPEISEGIQNGDPVNIDHMPKVSTSGYSRPLTQAEFLGKRIRNMAISYIVLDFLAVFMVKDPFFILGPEHNHPLPAYLKELPNWMMISYHELYTLAGVYGAIELIFDLHDLVEFYLVSYIFPIRGEVWQYTTVFGSPMQVLDRGLAGWWGSWWHQTFRAQFFAPATYLIKHGYLDRGSMQEKIFALFVAFFQSAFLHASGSASTMPQTKVWRAPVFFILQGVGIVIQYGLRATFRQYTTKTPQWLSRLSNLLFSLLWLQLTSIFFVDDLASTRLWLLEPVPISPLRWMGLGHPDDHWWRWTREQFPMWYSGGRWWETGIAL